MSSDTDSRPLSPHLQVYRWRISMAVSIMHRVSGVLLSIGTAFLVLWLYAAATDAVLMQTIQAILNSIIGKLVLFGWSAALFLHLLNGIRHLFWDAGIGFEKHQFRLTGWAVVAGTILLTLATWLLASTGGVT